MLLILVASAAAGTARRDLSHANDFIILFPVELIAVLAGGVAAGRYLAGRRDRASGGVGVGLYLVVVGAAVGTVFPIWLPSDNTILGSAVLAGLLTGVGTGLTLAGGAGLGGRPRPGMAAACVAGGVLAFLAVTAGGMVYPLAQLRLPVVVAALVTIGVLPLVWRWRQLVVLPLAVAVAGAVVTVAALVARGPGDWASASTSIKLYSFPIVLLALVVSLIILNSSRPVRRPQPPRRMARSCDNNMRGATMETEQELRLHDPASATYDDLADVLINQAAGLDPAVWDDLVDRLAAYDVTYLGGGRAGAGGPPQYRGPADVDLARLIRELARAPEPRLRDALIALLLRHPDAAPTVRAALVATATDDPARASLTARLLVAAALQRRHRWALRQQLPGYRLIDVTDLVGRLDLPAPETEDGRALLWAAQGLVAGRHPWVDYVDGWEDVARHVLRELAGGGSYTLFVAAE